MSDSETASRVKNSQSKSFRRLNPHLFQVGGAAIQNHGHEDDEELEHIAALTAPRPAKKRIRQSAKPLLNNLEKQFLEVLKVRFPFNEVSYVTMQAIRFSLGNGIAYKPDFVVFRTMSGTLAYECKGPHSFRGGLENLKVAANKYPLVTFILVWKDEQGQWQEQHVLP